MIGRSFVLTVAITLAGLGSARAAAGASSPGAQAGMLDGKGAAPAILAAAHGGVPARGGVRAASRFGSPARFGNPVFRAFPGHRVPFRPFPFRPFVGFGFFPPLYLPYYAPYYGYNPYCDPASAYYYPPWCSY